MTRKISDEQRVEIRALHAAGVSQRELARRFNVTRGSIRRIVFPELCKAVEKVRQAGWYKRNAAKKKAKQKIYRDSNRESCLRAVKRWQVANPVRVRELGRMTTARRRARLHDAGGVGFDSPDDMANVINLGWGGCCCYCEQALGFQFELDHIVPIVRGGSHTPENLAPACMQCNRSKGPKLLSEWRGGVFAESVPAHAAAIARILYAGRAGG